MPGPFTRAWSETEPADTQEANLLGQDLRQLKQDVREHICMSGAIADRPTPEAAWVGLLYFTTDEAKIYRWDGSAWIDSTLSILGNPPLAGDIADRPSGAYVGQIYFSLDENKLYRWSGTDWVDVTTHLAEIVRTTVLMDYGSDSVTPGAGGTSHHKVTLGWQPSAASAAFGFQNFSPGWSCWVESLDADGFTITVQAPITDPTATRINWMATGLAP